ncbi:hypothetical protein BSKO_07910 [Bryopsis sp. KO-2023]|nr:hypothetical protein BSKO_07910 [Bryopsis sp. KO-2023]
MSNPFSHEPNPFADPAVTVHTDSADQEGYNDVLPATGNAWGQGGGGAWSAPPVIQETPERDPPSSDVSAEQKVRAAREAELKRRETDLVQRERQLNQRAGSMKLQNNWPPFRPILYHDIDAEIPDVLRLTVKWGYWSYLLFVATVVYNFVAISLSLVEDPDVLAWVFAAIYLVTGIPGAWVLWYGRLYNAAKNDRAFTFMCFFIGYLAHIAFCILAAIAIPKLGESKSFCGLIRTLEIFKKATWIGVLFLIGFAGWVANAVISIYVWQQVMRDFRGRGGPTQLRNQTEAAAGRVAMNAAVHQATRA